MTHDVFLFLDFDGVLHEEPTDYFAEPEIPFAHVLAFEAMLRMVDPTSRVRIVISSTWREHETLAELRAHFAEDIAARIIDVTPILPPTKLAWGDSCRRGLRQSEIETWMTRNAPGSPWVAVDDQASGFRPGCSNLILVTPYDQDGRGLNQFILRDLRLALEARLSSPGAELATVHLPRP